MTTEESLAIAILKGDHSQAKALADLITETSRLEKIELKNVLDMSRDSLRILVFIKNHVQIDRSGLENIKDAVSKWLAGTLPVLCITGIERIEFYTIPKGMSSEQDQG